MREWAYAEKRGSGYRLCSFATGEPLVDGRSPAGVMMSRPDFDVQVVDLPEVPDREVEGFLKYRIRSLYPGHPEQTAFDYRIVERDGKRFAVLFLVQRALLDEYRALAAGRPLFLPFSLVQPLLERRRDCDTVFFFWHARWVEVLIWGGGEAGGEPLRSFALKRSADAAADLRALLRLIPAESGSCEWVLIAPAGETEGLAAGLRELAGEERRLAIVTLEEALGRLGRRSAFLFAPRRPRRGLSRAVRVQLYLAAALLLGFLVLHRSVGREQAYLARLRGRLATLQGQASRSVSLQKEVEELAAQLDSLRARRPSDPYLVLSELNAILSPEARIQSLVIEKGFFQMEALGQNPLRLMEAFGRSSLFSDVKLIQIVPQKDSDQELFRMTGTAHE